MQYALPGAYALTAAIHLFACANKDKLKLRRVSKCLLMPLLALCYILYARTFSLLVLAAVLCGFIGDAVLLLRPRRWAFLGGIVAFAAGHVLYSASFIQRLPSAPAWYIIAALVLICCASAFFLTRFLWHGLPKKLRIPSIVYMLIISTMASCSLLFAFSGASRFGWLAAAGGLMFVASDTTLALDAFHQPIRHRSIIVMSTYILAQTCIVFALALA